MKHQKEPENAGDIEMKDLNNDNEKVVGSDTKTPFLENEAPPPSDNAKNGSLDKIKNNLPKIVGSLIIFALIILGFVLYFKKEKPNMTIIGINFGSLNSGYYIIKDSNILGNYNMNYSDIILDEYGLKGLEIGYRAHIYSKNDLEKEKRLYFSNIKRYLVENKRIDEENIFSDFPKQKEVALNIIIEEYLNLLKEYIKKNENIKNINNKYLKWVITVPSIWNKENINIMEEILEDLEMDNYEIISEADASSVGIFYEENIKQALIENKVYMLINFDLFNIDINVNKVKDDKKNKIKQLIPSLSYNSNINGSYSINEQIIDILEHVFGYEDIQDKMNNNYDLWQKTLDDIENKKLLINENMVEELDILTQFSEGYKKYILKEIWSVDYQNYEVKHSKGKVMIPLSLLKNLIHSYCKNVIQEIDNIIGNLKEKVDIFIIGGEMSKSKILQDNIMRSYSKSYEILYLDDIEKTIMKGSAIYGLKK
jgi:hypothetical protein